MICHIALINFYVKRLQMSLFVLQFFYEKKHTCTIDIKCNRCYSTPIKRGKEETKCFR